MNFLNLLMFTEAAGNAGTNGDGTQGGAGSLLTLVLPLGLLALVFYFFIYRPQKKQERETADMRNSIELGDIIVTTGGIVAMVVKITEDMLLIESSGSRTKLQIQKWAVSSVIEKANEPEVKEVKEVKRVDSGIKMKEDKKSRSGKKKEEK